MIFLSLGLIIIDQITKVIASNYLNDSVKIIKDFFYFTYVENTGAAWGVFNNYLILLILITFVALYLIYKYSKNFVDNKRNNVAFSLLYAGIIGNLIDRICFGHVRDFIDFKIFGYDFPVFNIADMAICIGVFLLVLAIIKKEDINEVGSKRR